MLCSLPGQWSRNGVGPTQMRPQKSLTPNPGPPSDIQLFSPPAMTGGSLLASGQPLILTETLRILQTSLN